MNGLKYIIGADIGGTHCTAALVDLHQKKIVPSSFIRMDIDAGGEADEIINAWVSCILSAGKNVAITALCMAMPGPFDYEGGISWMKGQRKYERLYGLNVKELLAHKLPMMPAQIFINNDAACFLYGEVFAGAAAKYADETVIGITLGTGLGSAIYKQGSAKNADMWCMPFKGGLAEDYISSGWCIRRFHELSGIVVPGVKELAQSATTNEHAKIVFDEFGSHLAQFLLHFIQTEQPAGVFIGGNICKAFNLFGHTVRQTIGNHHPHIAIEPSMLGEEALLLGAVGSWLSGQQL